mmetsp:Transcript_32656/g.74344  ORF Transcript_32656/g.74344 Transcript_32656/m.74344 type:complete len:676 (-) Transcript_32656:85-2112(-)
MKFGKSIGSQQDGNVDLHYVDYKLLKKRIKDVVEQLQAHELNKALRANSDFDIELEAEIEQVNACFGRRQQQLLEQTGSLSEELQACESLTTGGDATAMAAQRPEAFKRLVAILGEVDQLRKYAVWNAVGVVKILKKRRKQTHFGLEDTAAERAAWLSRQSFFSGSDFAELHAAVESLGHVLVLSELMPLDGSSKRPQLQKEKEPQQCPICLDTISDMVELSCNHRFCWKCFVLGPIAFQPGEYRMTQCPICRTETVPEQPAAVGDGDPSCGVGIPSSEGLLTRFLHTYFPKEGLGQADTEDPAEQALRQEGEESEREMRDVVGELVRALMADSALPRSGKGAFFGDDEEPGRGGSSSSAAPADFFDTLPRKTAQERLEQQQQLGAAQKLQWLQLASTGDSFALDGTMYCSLCSEPLLMEAVVTTPCKHHFHRICISRLEEPKCPLCASELPFDWFISKDHPCAECGFRVVKMKDYRPLFPGGPSRGSHGYPLHRPPPVNLLGPGGLTMKSYLHRIVPMGGEEDVDEAQTPRSATAGPPSRCGHGGSPETPGDEHGDNSSASESSSEDSGSEDGGERTASAAHSTKRSRQRTSWAYSAIGRVRLLDPADLPAVEEVEPDDAPHAAARPHAASAGSVASGALGGSSGDAFATTSRAAANAEAEQRNSTVLLLGRHL